MMRTMSACRLRSSMKVCGKRIFEVQLKKFRRKSEPSLLQRVRQRTKYRRPVAVPCAAVHTGEVARLFRGEAFDQVSRVARVRVVIKRGAQRLAWCKYVGFRERLVTRTWLREKVAAEECSRLVLHHQPALPAVRHVRCVEPLDRMMT